ncbi:MAG: IS21 family transposase, partial [Sphingobacterium sp.]
MSQIKQLIRLYQGGSGIKTIARILGMSKNTVKSYLKKMADGGFNTGELLKQDDPLLERSFHSGNPAYKADKFEYLKSRLDYYEKELRRTGVTKLLLWREYIENDPTGYSYPQFTYHLRQQLVSRKGSMVMEHSPGDKLYIDFSGKKLHYIDRTTGELVACEVFVACLPFSDYGFAIAVPSQQTPDFLYALSRCLEVIGGVPNAIVPDNLKAAVIKADKYEPILNQSMEDFANHYGTVVVPARAGRPKDKSLVENQVKMIYTRVRFELKYYTELKVGNNGHIYLQRNKHFYSVPFTYIGIKVKIIYTRSMISIYCQGKQIATHIRSYKENAYTTLAAHLKSEHQAYKKRSHENYLARARAHSME